MKLAPRCSRAGAAFGPLTVAALLLVSACHTLTPVSAPSWPQRAAQLRAIARFEFSGRIATVMGDKGVSAALIWQQQGEDSTLSLRAPFGLGALNIDYHDQQLRVTSDDGQRVEGAAAEHMLTDLLGFSLPLNSIHYWLLGCSDPASVADESLDDRQRLAQLRQNGWRIDYLNYQSVGKQWFPQRLNMERDGRKLKLVVERWQLP